MAGRARSTSFSESKPSSGWSSYAFMRSWVGRAIQRGIDGGAIFGDIAAAGDRCRYVFRAPVHDQHDAGRSRFFKHAPQTYALGRGFAGIRRLIVREIEHEEIDAPRIFLLNL